MMNHNVPVHCSSKFTWHKRTGSAELSDFESPRVASLVYDDAADVGFFVVSQKTGTKKLFTLLERTEDGWRFESEDGLVVKIFND
jgi:hypothetical protein